MNGFGLDRQAMSTQIVLREGEGQAARLRSVGDGVREIVPHLVAKDAFGSRAAALEHEAAPHDRAWSGPSATAFLTALRGRVSAYLGRMEPTRRNGFATCVALNARDLERARSAQAALFEQAGWEDVTFVSATRALAALAPRDDTRRVAAIVVGDKLTSIEIFETSDGTVAALNAQMTLNQGARAWEDALRETLRSRISAAIPDTATFDLALRNAAMEFAVALGRARADRPVAWSGPLAELAYTDVALSRADCATWPSVKRLAEFVAETVSASAADLVVIGGVGAAWPFVADAAARFADVRVSGAPWEDVARGAAMLAGSAQIAAIAPPKPIKAIAAPVRDDNDDDEKAPWLRRGDS